MNQQKVDFKKRTRGMNSESIRLALTFLSCVLCIPAFSQDIVFSKNCLETAAVELTQSPTLSSNEVMDLKSIQLRTKHEAETYQKLADQSKVKFPSGRVVDMRSNTTVASQNGINKELAIIEGDDPTVYDRSNYWRFSKVLARGEWNGSFDEWLVLRSYKKSGYGLINRGLRYHEFSSLEEENAFIKVIQYLNSALNRIEPYQGYVKRGASLAPEVLEQFQNGKLFSFKTYVSASLRPDPIFISAQEQNRVVFILRSRTGRPIEKVTNYYKAVPINYDEAEVIFKPQTTFKILEVKKENGVTKVYADEMP